MTPDIDKLQSILQWAGGVAVVVGGAIAAIIKIVRGGHEESEREREDRERAERSRRCQLERQVEIVELERKFELSVGAVREAILGKLDRTEQTLRTDIKSFDDRLRAVEQDVAALSQPRRQR